MSRLNMSGARIAGDLDLAEISILKGTLTLSGCSLTTAFLCAKHAVPKMLREVHCGSICLVAASITGQVDMDGLECTGRLWSCSSARRTCFYVAAVDF
jgi:hypothetical protein